MNPAPTQPAARYRLGRVLGKGGMAIVYEAMLHDRGSIGQRVVVKRILPDVARDNGFVKMFLAEARLSVMLRHPNIVRVFELGAMDGQPFLAMEHIDGCDVVTVAKRCAAQKRLIPVEVALRVVAEVAQALEYAHTLVDESGRALEIVHRDISPSNVMLTAAGGVKLLDFGIAKAASFMRDDLTRTGTLKGKISYMSPEQADGDPVDKRSDIFSLGIVLHEMLTMRRVFRGEDDLQTLRRIRDCKPPAPSELRPGDITPELDAIVLKMLARDRQQRYQSCADVAAALAPLVREGGGSADRQRVFVSTLQLGAGPAAARGGATGAVDLASMAVEVDVEATALTPAPLALARDPRDEHSNTLNRSTGEMQSIALPDEATGGYRRSVVVAASCGAALVAAGIAFVGFGGVSTSRRVVDVTPAAAARLQANADALTTANVATALPNGRPASALPNGRPASALPNGVPANAPPNGRPASAPPSVPVVTSAPPARPALPIDIEPSPVRLHVIGTEGAQVVQGDRVLGTVPLTTMLDPQPAKRALVIRKPGFHSVTRVIEGDAHAEIEVELARLPRKIAKPSTEGQIKDPF